MKANRLPLPPLQNGHRQVVRTCSSGDDYDPFATVASTKSLADHLNEQAQLAFTSAHDRLIARYLVDLVDVDGYIRSPLEDVAASLSTSLEEIERVLATLQTFDPPGICARDLAECMALQLKEKNRYDPFMERLLANLDLIAACDFQRLKKVCGVDAEDLREMIAELRQLNPRPGRSFDRVEIETLVPDVIVRRGPDGEWRAELNPGAAPSLAVDRAYYASLKARCRSNADRNYLGDRLSSANWLVKSLEQRLVDNPEGRDGCGGGAVRVLRSWRAPLEAVEPAADRREDRDA